MSDIRFIMVGTVLIFAGFLTLGIFGHDYQIANIQTNEFDECYQYQDNKEPVKISCSTIMFEQTLFFMVVIVLIAGGIISLVKGVKGKWDNEVKPEDMVGPGNDKKTRRDT